MAICALPRRPRCAARVARAISAAPRPAASMRFKPGTPPAMVASSSARISANVVTYARTSAALALERDHRDREVAAVGEGAPGVGDTARSRDLRRLAVEAQARLPARRARHLDVAPADAGRRPHRLA